MLHYEQSLEGTLQDPFGYAEPHRMVTFDPYGQTSYSTSPAFYGGDDCPISPAVEP